MEFGFVSKVALVATFVLSLPALSFAQDTIIGGTDVAASDAIARTTVAIVNETEEGTALCSGSLLSADLVVTAAHCVGPDAANMRVLFGRDINDPNLVVLGVADFLANPAYDANADVDANDIALVKIEGNVPSGFATAELLPKSTKLADGETVTLAGYGVTDDSQIDDGNNNGAGVLRKTDVSIKQADYGKSEVLFDQTSGHAACHGDSGGPAFLSKGGHLYLFGVTSRGVQTDPNADECSGEVVYTNILGQSAFLTQAAQTLEGN